MDFGFFGGGECLFKIGFCLGGGVGFDFLGDYFFLQGFFLLSASPHLGVDKFTPPNPIRVLASLLSYFFQNSLVTVQCFTILHLELSFKLQLPVGSH